MLLATIAAVKKVAREEVMPRYLKVAHERKTDGSLFTQADIAAQNALSKELTKIRNCPLLGEEMKDDEHLVKLTACEVPMTTRNAKGM